MMYPPFLKDEYDCLKPDLAGPLIMHEQEQIEKRVSAQEKVRDTTKARFLTNKEIRQKIEDEILAVKSDTTELTKADKIEYVVGEIRRILSKRQQYGNDYDDVTYTGLIREVKDMYGNFDIVAWKKDFSAALPEGGLSKTEKQHRRAAKSAETQRQKIDADYLWSEHFVSVPNQWRGASLKLMGKETLAATICRTFIKDWKERSAKFARAVTINGVLIESLPDGRKQIWEQAYKQIGIDKIAKSGIFQYVLYRQESAPAPPAPTSVPEVFHASK